MNILYIASVFPTPKEGSNLYTDLAEELIEKGNKVTVVVSEERQKIDKTQMQEERNIKVLRVKTGNLYDVSLYEKAISFITLQTKLKNAIKEYLSNEKFDLIIFMSPPVTLYSVVQFAMKKYNCISYLMQKDIFPQNALDLGLMTKMNPSYWYFKHKEKELYKTSTVIGCMSNANKEYLLKNNKYLNSNKVQIFPNTIKINKINSNIKSKLTIREKYNIPKEKIIAVYGGNFGRAQGIDFLIQVLNEYKNNNKIMFILYGRGTEKNRLINTVKQNNIKNVIIKDYASENEYSKLLQEADIGLVFLDYRFTIPNIPSRTLAYFKYGIPIMAATDKKTDYKKLIEQQSKSGLWCESNNIKEFKNKFNFLIENKEEREKMGKRGRKYLENNLTTDISVEILQNTFDKLKGGKNV